MQQKKTIRIFVEIICHWSQLTKLFFLKFTIKLILIYYKEKKRELKLKRIPISKYSNFFQKKERKRGEKKNHKQHLQKVAVIYILT